MPKKNEKDDEKEKPHVNPELEGFDIEINEFGQIVSNYDVDKINKFLDRNVEDKKLKNNTERIKPEGDKDELDLENEIEDNEAAD